MDVFYVSLGDPQVFQNVIPNAHQFLRTCLGAGLRLLQNIWRSYRPQAYSHYDLVSCSNLTSPMSFAYILINLACCKLPRWPWVFISYIHSSYWALCDRQYYWESCGKFRDGCLAPVRSLIWKIGVKLWEFSSHTCVCSLNFLLTVSRQRWR